MPAPPQHPAPQSLEPQPPAPRRDTAPLRVTTLNLNGLRSALRRGLADWLTRQTPDVLLLQEVRADPHAEVFAELGYGGVWHAAEKKGYSGVALLARRGLGPLLEVRVGFGDEALDREGRLVSGVLPVAGPVTDRAGPVRFASLYLPSGSSGEERQAFKERSLPLLSDWTRARLAEGPLVIGGDFNVAHREIDLKNWRSNRGSSGFLPQERAWMGEYLALGLQDSHREALGERAAYTWWSTRGAAFQNDVGWRIDYLLAGGVRLDGVQADREARLSDHAPLSGWLRG